MNPSPGPRNTEGTTHPLLTKYQRDKLDMLSRGYALDSGPRQFSKKDRAEMEDLLSRGLIDKTTPGSGGSKHGAYISKRSPGPVKPERRLHIRNESHFAEFPNTAEGKIEAVNFRKENTWIRGCRIHAVIQNKPDRILTGEFYPIEESFIKDTSVPTPRTRPRITKEMQRILDELKTTVSEIEVLSQTPEAAKSSLNFSPIRARWETLKSLYNKGTKALEKGGL